MTDSTSVSQRLATLGPNGWQVPGLQSAVGGPPSWQRKPVAPVERINLYGQLVAGTIGNTTFQTAIAMESPFYQVRVGVINGGAASLQVDRLAIGVGDVFTDNHPTTSGSGSGLTQGTYNGGTAIATTPMVCAAAATGPIPSITWTDWLVPLNIGLQMGTTGLYPLFVQTYVSTVAGFSLASNANFPGNPFNVNGDRFKRSGSNTNANGNSVNGSYGGAQFTQCLPLIIEARCLRRTVSVMTLGDSIVGGTDLSDGADSNCYGFKACYGLNAAQAGIRFACANFGWGGQTTTLFSNRLPSLLANMAPDVLVYRPYSNNNGVGSQAAVNLLVGQLLGVISQCVTAGVALVLETATPIPGISAADDILRKQANATTRAIALSNNILIMDTDAALSDGASPAAYLPGYNTSSNQHPNPAGRDVQARLLQGILMNFLGQ